MTDERSVADTSSSLTDTLPAGVTTHVRLDGEIDAPESVRYVESAVLGRGGMGVVKLCHDRRVGRDVALKLELEPNRQDSGRFAREALVQGQLEHPSIVPVYDVGLDRAGATFFTMKRVHGSSLLELIEGLHDAPPEVIERSRHKLLSAVASVCLAVDFAHARGVIHRDIKPGNVMLGAWGEVYLLDWGIAKVLSGGDAPDPISLSVHAGAASAHTAAGAMLGTPGYMAPEQLVGQPVARANDVYALGAVLFEVLTLERLHVGESFESVVASTVIGEPQAVAERLAKAGAAPELSAICLRALARDPDDRYASARQLNEAIGGYLEGDRDLELRRELAIKHAAAGVALAKADERSEALREIGRALALDPDNRGALRALVDLLSSSPRETPPAVEAELATDMLREERRATRRGQRAILAFGAIVVAALLMGLRSFVPFIVQGAALSVVFIALRATRRYIAVRRMLIFALLMLSIAAVSRFFGSLILVPTLVASVSVSFAYHATSRQRWLGILPLAVAAIVGPVALEMCGVLSPSYVVTSGSVVVVPHLASFPAASTLPIMTLLTAIGTTITLLLIGALADSLAVTKKQVALQSWQLRQLVPEEARAPR